MTILALLIGLLIYHFTPSLSALRRYRWLTLPAAVIADRSNAWPDWLPMMLMLFGTVLIGLLATVLADNLAGDFGVLLLSLLVIIYTLGPRDLDDDIEHAVSSDDARDSLRLGVDANGVQAAATVLHAALARWFGVMFWFVLLGVPGALLYRAARVAQRSRVGTGKQQAWFRHLLFILNWPVLLLMTLAVALMTDLDRVRTSWSAQTRPWQLNANWLDQLAVTLCTPDCDAQQGLNEGQALAWRMLWIWLAVLSILLMAGWIA
ncbi:MAG: hypothetical protein AAF446_04650 [Pseudomonadota bacterium]